MALRDMRTPATIWESASRPLFVRSVWLETSSAGREAHQRHFILDYEPSRQQRPQKSAASPTRRRDSLKRCMSFDCADSLDSDESPLASREELMLIGSGKVPHPSLQQLRQQQQQQQLLQQQRQRFHRSHRRQSGAYRRQYAGLRRVNERPELQSRRSSLQDLPAALANAGGANPDERLAERVLNWLDLAGKTDFLKDEPREMEATADKKTPSKTTATTTTCGNGRSTTARPALRQRGAPRPSTSQTQPRVCKTGARSGHGQTRQGKAVPGSACGGHHRHGEAVKHITIIFNKEGVPVRFNRPVRNIDLCALASSASTTRRLAGNLASARLYSSSAECAATASAPRKPLRGAANVAAAQRRRLHDQGEDASRSPAQHRIYDEAFYGTAYDAKKQLHIFMPSLPKKSLRLEGVPEYASGTGTGDDGTSLLSHHFSELCRV